MKFKSVVFFVFGKFNLFRTIYINFKMLPLNQAVRLPIYVFGDFKFVEMNGSIELSPPVKRGMVSIGVNIAGYVSTPRGTLRMKCGSKIIFQNKVIISQGSQLFINDNAELIMESGAKLGDSVKIICYKKIVIGEMSEITWESQVTDFNSHYILNLDNRSIENITDPVHIGKKNWIGNRTSVMPGTILPDNIIVASNSLLNRNYVKKGVEEFSLIGGMPARIIRNGNMKRIYSREMEKRLFDYFKQNNVQSYICNNVDDL